LSKCRKRVPAQWASTKEEEIESQEMEKWKIRKSSPEAFRKKERDLPLGEKRPILPRTCFTTKAEEVSSEKKSGPFL